MKVGLLLPANLYFCPYANIYRKILDDNHIDYEIICWNKAGVKEDVHFSYDKKMLGTSSTLLKLIGYYAYARFLKKQVRAKQYDKLVVFGPQIAIFLYSLLRKYYKRSFVLDYRDLSIEQKFQKIYLKLLNISALNVVSSPGFLSCLPNTVQYELSHNMDESAVLLLKDLKFSGLSLQSNRIVILTIGAIRDCEQNIELLDSLADNKKFDIRFVGKSDFSEIIRHYAQSKHFNNVDFIGFYKKEDEHLYVEESTFMNIYYPRKLSHDTALSNRFYNALLYYKPMIVTKNTVQGDLVEKYNLGIAIENCDDLPTKLERYIEQFDQEAFVRGRQQLLDIFLDDQKRFKREFLKSLL